MEDLRVGFKNSRAILLSTLVVIILGFVSRIFFLRELGSTALGLNSFFNSILSALSIADVGMDTVLVYILLKPIHESDTGLIRGLMKLIRRIYNYIGLSVVMIGAVVAIFLPQLMPNDDVSKIVYILFFMYLFNSASSYYFAEYRVLLNALQKSYIVSFYTAIITMLMVLVQIVVLVTTKSFILFELVQIVATISMGACGFYFVRQNIDLKVKPEKVPREVIHKLLKNAIGGLANKVGVYFVNGSDSVLLSIFSNLKTVGIYSNYMMLINALGSISQKAISALTPTLGTKSIDQTPEERYVTFDYQNILIYLVSYIMFVGLLFNSDWFITVWLGKANVLGGLTTFLLSFNLFIRLVRLGPLNYIDALGLQWQQKYKPIVEAVVNIVVAVFLFKLFDMKIDAVLLGTLVSNFSVVLWYEPYVVFKNGVELKKSYFKNVRNLIILVVLASGSYAYLSINGIHSISISIIVTTILTVIATGIITQFGSTKINLKKYIKR